MLTINKPENIVRLRLEDYGDTIELIIEAGTERNCLLIFDKRTHKIESKKAVSDIFGFDTDKEGHIVIHKKQL